MNDMLVPLLEPFLVLFTVHNESLNVSPEETLGGSWIFGFRYSGNRPIQSLRVLTLECMDPKSRPTQ